LAALIEAKLPRSLRCANVTIGCRALGVIVKVLDHCSAGANTGEYPNPSRVTVAGRLEEIEPG
jgi:hypothetical protein